MRTLSTAIQSKINKFGTNLTTLDILRSQPPTLCLLSAIMWREQKRSSLISWSRWLTSSGWSSTWILWFQWPLSCRHTPNLLNRIQIVGLSSCGSPSSLVPSLRSSCRTRSSCIRDPGRESNSQLTRYLSHWGCPIVTQLLRFRPPSESSPKCLASS